MRHQNRLRISIGWVALLTAALMLLVLPLKWMTAAVAAAIWHESCHGIAVKLCGGTIRCVRVGSHGAVMECEPMSMGRELLCSLAGPLGSILLVFLAKWCPRTAVCGLIHAVYNLLPVYPLDGGRALHSAVLMLLPCDRAERFFLHFERAVIAFAVIAAAVSAFVLDLGVIPVLAVLILLYRVKREKSLANCGCRGYNRPTIVKR